MEFHIGIVDCDNTCSLPLHGTEIAKGKYHIWFIDSHPVHFFKPKNTHFLFDYSLQ